MPADTGRGPDIVLLADDDAFMRSIVAGVIRSALGCDVELAASGRDAIGRLVSPRPAVTLALLDFVMPDGNGLEVARAVRAGLGDVPRDLPIVMLTGRADGGLVRAAMELDVNGYLVKPVTREALLARIDRAASLPFDLKAPDLYRHVAIPDPVAADRPRPAVHPAAATPAPAAPAAPGETASDGAVPRVARVEVRVADLRPGAVLAAAVRANGGGSVILPAHVRLDRALVARLSDLADMGMIPPMVFVLAVREG